MLTDNWLIFSLFLATATLLSFGYGWGVKNEKLPFLPIMNFSAKQWKFMEIWVQVALIIAVIIPILMLINFWYQPIARQFWQVYLLILGIQIICEASFRRWLVKSVVVIIGLLYTIFRLWELIEGFQTLDFPQPWLSLFGLLLLFWSGNLIMLVFMAIPNIMPQKQSSSHLQ